MGLMGRVFCKKGHSSLCSAAVLGGEFGNEYTKEIQKLTSLSLE
jgi:hypothetical protein